MAPPRGWAPNPVRVIGPYLIVGAANAYARGVQKCLAELPKDVRALAKVLDIKNMATEDMRVANLEIASAAQQAIVAGWRNRLPLKSGNYRPQDRLTGRLGPALESEAMIEGTTNRVISFVNIDHLYREAAHWYRVNYGAGGVAAPPEEFPVRFGTASILTLRDESPPRRGNYLPAVFRWHGSGMGAEFSVIRGPATERGPGSRAARFTDLGLKVVAKEFPNVYTRLFHEYLTHQGQQARLAKKGIDVKWDPRGIRHGGFTT